MTLRLNCTCGATWNGMGIPPARAALVKAMWARTHGHRCDLKPGHRPTTAAVAARARARAEEKAVKESANG